MIIPELRQACLDAIIAHIEQSTGQPPSEGLRRELNEAVEDFGILNEEEALGYAFTIAEEYGISADRFETILKEKGILE